jgi:DNA mismatch repair protein MutS
VQLLVNLRPQQELVDFLKSVLTDDPPLVVGDGRTIKDCFSVELDELRSVRKNASQWILNHQAQERARSDVKTLEKLFEEDAAEDARMAEASGAKEAAQ